MAWKCSYMKPLNTLRVALRKATASNVGEKCPDTGHGHSARNFVESVEFPFDDNEWQQFIDPSDEDSPLWSIKTAWHAQAEAWPTHCSCGYEFKPNDYKSVEFNRWYQRDGDDTLYVIGEMPIGAIFNSMWNLRYNREEGPKSYWTGEDGMCLSVVCPGGVWCIDSRASNCDMREDDIHRCWVRTGVPPELHVGKDGNTCGAGAGSIWIRMGSPDSYHWFIHHGQLTDPV
jgi:hypothetical protein